MTRGRLARWVGFLVSVLLVAGVAQVVTAPPAEAVVVNPFTQNYNANVYGDFIEVGNGNMRCPTQAEFGSQTTPALSQCAGGQQRTDTQTNTVNDFFPMRWADVDSVASTFNSSTSTLTIPPGATVRYARLNWAGNTGVYRNSSGTVVTDTPQCGSAGTAVSTPSGTPEAQSVRLTIGSGTGTAVAPGSFTRDPNTAFPNNNNPQYYSAYANVTSAFANAATGSALPITVGNVWSPQGFNCFAGWSLVLVYGYDGPNPTYAPQQRSVFIYDGHVRQFNGDSPTTVNIAGYRVSDPTVRLGVTAYEGDFNIVGDTLSVGGTNIPEPATGATNNYFVSDVDGATNPNVPNNYSVDAKVVNLTSIPAGSTSTSIAFATTGDSYLAQNIVFSAPIPSLDIQKDTVGGPFRPGTPVTFRVTVTNPGGAQATNVAVADARFPGCARSVGTVASGVRSPTPAPAPHPGPTSPTSRPSPATARSVTR